MLLRSWPVRFLITRAARAYGFLDPIAFVAKLRGFAQPSEVAEPIELLRAGMLFHARGLLNTKAIQNNLDWVWPYWVERQFRPGDESFIPRAFSFSHINLTHRNWTAVGVPDVPFYPLVDPRGLVTPQFDGWSLDFWLIPAAGPVLFPSKSGYFEQALALTENLQVRSAAEGEAGRLETLLRLEMQAAEPQAAISVHAPGTDGGFVGVALRPYNPEGISAIDRISVLSDRCGWSINGRNIVSFDRPPSRHLLSVYADGDVSHRLAETGDGPENVVCPVGMATAVALFPVKALKDCPLEIRAPIYDELETKKRPRFPSVPSWREAIAPMARLTVSSHRIQQLYDLAAANLILHSPRDVYPGPFTYKRFWFRDAAFVLNALLALGAVDRARRALQEFGHRQRHDGYYLSQEGEWDSNGEAIWILHRFWRLTGEALPDAWVRGIGKGARWISRKRLPRGTGKPEAGLLPAGFSAEHLGPNDYYYWDDFWGVAGLRCAADILESREPATAAELRREADDFLATIEQSFPNHPQRRFPGAIPASPKRRMDSGAIGSIVADYPLQLFGPGDDRILRTANYLRDHSMHTGGFFQNMIHSGINAYLTLHLAQVRLRAGDPQSAWDLMERVADLASPTGQWPEAIHPRTLGGCMGDGQHIWAAGEWALMIRNCFVREEGQRLVIGSGVPVRWIPEDGKPASFGPTLTPWGRVTATLRRRPDGVMVGLAAEWRGRAPALEIAVPGFESQLIENPAERTDVALHSRP
ncbi:hypothetical protein DB347_16990 [Opitutaceae bacterium EW11]|nr:hypothetical protein DB347_16990 [Opitutaceae bacterium EW11]